tara:strand:- start:1811 stop:2401 length:591 start_codon:yes stop_codon:yes gene_type:complete
MLRSIKLYGHLREVTGLSEFKIHARTVRDAISMLICNWPELESQIAQNYYQVLVGKDNIVKEEIDYPAGSEPISFIPVVVGAGSMGKIIAGAALIGVAVATGGTATAGVPFLKALTTLKGLYASAATIGLSLISSGIADFFAPDQEIPEEDQEQKSFAFQSPLNVSFAGVPVPIAYGTIVVGSVVINAGQEIGDVA